MHLFISYYFYRASNILKFSIVKLKQLKDTMVILLKLIRKLTWLSSNFFIQFNNQVSLFKLIWQSNNLVEINFC